VNLPYWTTEFVHLGPFRLTDFDPGDAITFRAYDGYFLGRPKLDVVRVRLFADEQPLFSNILGGAVDLTMESTLTPDLGFQLERMWTDGVVYYLPGGQRFVAPQWRPSMLIEPAILDVRVRAALYHAQDREALAEALQGGHKEMAAFEILPPHDLLHAAVKDGLRPYAYDPDRARAILRDAGWNPGPDGVFRNDADGRRFRSPISASEPATRHIPAPAAYWRQLGLDVDEIAIPTAEARNPEYRASYPGWELTSQGVGDSILGKLEGPAASAQTRWTGNRGGYEDARAQQLVNSYRASLSERDQLASMKAVSDFIAAELPILVLYGQIDSLPARNGVMALNDYDGGEGGGRPYGTFTRNSHLWDVQ
jgi:peptide/nickel transport system substrate-binding protein